jgi:murein L,D-transpeptidase YcbB/YkuD
LRQLIVTLFLACAVGASASANDDVASEVELSPEPVALPAPTRFDSEWTESSIDELAGALFEASSHGLPSLDQLALRLENPNLPFGARAELATHAFMTYGGWLRFGMLDEETLEPRILDAAEHAILVDALRHAVETEDVYATLEDLVPPVRDYPILRAAMMRLLTIEPIWPTVDAGPALRLGDSGPRVEQLRARLAAAGVYADDWSAGAVFDVRLETAVRRFQGQVNLSPSGRMDQSTLRQLNVQPGERIAQLRSNLEQRRWRSRDLGRRHIWVNLADFHLETWEDGELVREHEVMVGRQVSSTPEFSEEMQYIVLNPWWGIPAGSARARFRSLQRNPGLQRLYGFRIFDRAGQAISVYDVDWSRWGNDWPYRISQPPGPRNPMGEVKFIFPNRHNIYLHDTIERDRFIRTRRDFSAGCIRVQDPMALAEWLLEDQDDWSRSRIDAVADGESPTVVWLDERVPVHIAYWTVVGDANGEVRFLNDLYRRDASHIAAFSRAFDANRGDGGLGAGLVALSMPVLD